MRWLTFSWDITVEGAFLTHHALSVCRQVVEGDTRQQSVHLPGRLLLRFSDRIGTRIEESFEVVLWNDPQVSLDLYEGPTH